MPNEVQLTFPTIEERLFRGLVLPESIVSGTLVARKSVTIFAGPEDSFKSTLMCQLALDAAHGTSWCGWSCEQCNTVVYLVIEGGDDYLLERMENMAAALKLPTNEVFRRIRVQEYLYKDLSDKYTATELIERLKPLEPDLVIADPVTYAVAGDVRFSPPMTSLGLNLQMMARDLNAGVVAVMHTRKGANNNIDMDEVLGNKNLVNIAPTRVKVYRDDKNPNQLTLHAKTRNADRPETLELVFNYPIIEVAGHIRRPGERAKKAVLSQLQLKSPEVLGSLVTVVANREQVHEKTVRTAIENLRVERKVKVERVPGSAKKLVALG